MALTGRFNKRRSNAKNSYDLLSDFCTYALEEPKRVYMPDVIAAMGTTEIGRFLRFVDNNKGSRVIKEGPACGIIGCIAGDCAILKGFPLHNRAQHEIFTSAVELIAGPPNEEDGWNENDQLRDELVEMFQTTDIEANYGTRAYVRIVVRMVREFQRKWKRELLAIEVK